MHDRRSLHRSSDDLTSPSHPSAPGRSTLTSRHVMRAAAEPEASSEPAADGPAVLIAHDVADPKAKKKKQKEKGKVQRSADGEPTPAIDPMSRARDGMGGGGDVPYRGEMEAAFGVSFEGVRAHFGGAATDACADLGARAYTVGSDVVFATDAPDKRLVAHELTHVVQGGGGVRQKGEVSESGDAAEVEADAIADRVVSGASVAGQVTGSAPAIARDGGVAAALGAIKGVLDGIKAWNDVYDTVIKGKASGEGGLINPFISQLNKTKLSRMGRYFAAQRLCDAAVRLAQANGISLPLKDEPGAAPPPGGGKSPLQTYVDQLQTLTVDDMKDQAQGQMLSAIKKVSGDTAYFWDEDDQRGPIDRDRTYGGVHLELFGSNLVGWAGLPTALNTNFGMVVDNEVCNIYWFDGGTVRTEQHAEMFDKIDVKFLKEMQFVNDGKFAPCGAEYLKFEFAWDSNTTTLDMWVTVDHGRPWTMESAYHGKPDTGTF